MGLCDLAEMRNGIPFKSAEYTTGRVDFDFDLDSALAITPHLSDV